jgi:hypothetical protein
MEMSKRCGLVLLLFLAGCKSADKTAQTPEERGERWERIEAKQSVAFKLHAKNAIATATKPITPILYVGCGDLATIIAVRAPGDAPASEIGSSKVKFALDGAAPVEQQWIEIRDKAGANWSPESAEVRLHFLLQVLGAKTLRVDLISEDGSSRTATFDLLDFKDRFTHEPSCAAWRDRSRYQ